VSENNREILLSIPILGEEEKAAIAEVIESGWITMGSKVAAFEKAFAEMHNQNTAVAVSSCTAALHLILRALGVGPGDEVLVPSLTFVATVNAVLYVGATPVFVDIEGFENPTISIDDAFAKCTQTTKAAVVMHYGGYLVDLRPWRDFCDDRSLLLIEDAAHSPGLPQAASLSDGSAFSFFSNKNITTCEGGMVLSRHPNVLSDIRQMRGHGMTADTLVRYKGHAYSYDVTMIGYNYRMDELRAAIGLVQLSRLQEWNQKRRDLSRVYRELLASYVPEVVVPFDQSHETSAHLMPVILPKNVDRLRVIDYLRDNGIQSSIHYPSVHRFSFFLANYADVDLPKTEEFSARELTLPLHPALNRNDLAYIIEILRDSIDVSRV